MSSPKVHTQLFCRACRVLSHSPFSPKSDLRGFLFVSGGGPLNKRCCNKVLPGLNVMCYTMFFVVSFIYLFIVKGEKTNKGHKRRPQTVMCSPAMRSFSESRKRLAARLHIGKFACAWPTTYTRSHSTLCVAQRVQNNHGCFSLRPCGKAPVAVELGYAVVVRRRLSCTVKYIHES